MSKNGFIYDHRQELTSDIWAMPPLYHRLWQYLKYKVNYEDGEIPKPDGGVFLIKKGQHLTSIRSLAQGISWYEGLKRKEPNPKTISGILEWMVKRDMIKIDRGKGNREYTLITLLNWENYQHKHVSSNSKETPDGEASKQSADIKNKNKEELNKLKDISAEIENFRSRYSPELLQVIDDYLDFIRETRKNRKIADSIIIKIMSYFGKFSSVRVEYAIRAHMGNVEKKSAQEEYTFGIIRRTTEEEAQKKLQGMRHNGQSQLNGRLTPEQIQALEGGTW